MVVRAMHAFGNFGPEDGGQKYLLESHLAIFFGSSNGKRCEEGRLKGFVRGHE